MSVGSRIRYSMTDGPELRCVHCGEWWAVTPEFWDLANWAMCRACRRESARLYQVLRRRDPEFRRSESYRSRRYRAWVARTHPEYLAAYDRERKARDRARLRQMRQEAA